MRQLAAVYDLAPPRRARLFDLLGAVRPLLLDLDRVDQRWEGILYDGGRCVWLTDGRRIEYDSLGEGWVATTHPDPDPDYPGGAP